MSTSFARSLRDRLWETWDRGYGHPFLQRLGAGTLDPDAFRFYLKQGSRYMEQYVKVFAMAIVKASTEEQMLRIAELLHSILSRRSVHREYMFAQGVSLAEYETTELSLTARTYIAHLHNIGMTGDLGEILAAILPCYWIYNDYAARLQRDYAAGLSDNPYAGWMEMFTTERYAASFDWIFDMLDESCVDKGEQQLRRVVLAFQTSCELECLFWDMAYHQRMSY